MGNQFNWHFDENEPQFPTSAPQRPRRVFWKLTAMLVVSAVVVMGGWLLRARLLRAETALRDAAQAIVDQEHAAILAGDGEQLFADQLVDPAWQAIQLRPELVAQQHAGFEVTHAELQGDQVWVNASWQTHGQMLQRVLFFTQQPTGRLLRNSGDPAFWGGLETVSTEWGTLRIFSADTPFSASIANNVATFIADICAAQTCHDIPTLTVEISDQWVDSAEGHTIRLPSPRLMGISTNGGPGAAFWQLLSQRIRSQLTPSVIRTAIPPFRQQHLNYAAAAAAFSAENPHLQIELVEIDGLPGDSAELAAFDAVAFPPSVELIAAGQVRDLTPYAERDVRFAAGDFYEQIWQGAIWRERFWFVPQAAEMPLLFLDNAAYTRAGRPLPPPDWQWEQLLSDAAVLQTTPPTEFGLLDNGNSLPMAYAFSLQARCNLANNGCTRPLPPAIIAATQAWMADLMTPPVTHPDLSSLSTSERKLAVTRLQSLPRRAAIWVDESVKYEHQLQLGALTPTLFPRADSEGPTTPLWVEGTFITQASPHPDQTWQWLVFLSQYQALREFRLIPSRPSLAISDNYWYTLPEPIGAIQRAAFPLARPVPLVDRHRMKWHENDQPAPLRYFENGESWQ